VTVLTLGQGPRARGWEVCAGLAALTGAHPSGFRLTPAPTQRVQMLGSPPVTAAVSLKGSLLFSSLHFSNYE